MALICSCVLFTVVVLLAGCGSDEQSGEANMPPPGAPTTTVQTTHGEPPAPTVRSFLSAYQSGEAEQACRLVVADFTNPRDRTLRTPASCRMSAHGEDDVLAQAQEIVASDPMPPRARVLTLNAKRTQLLYELRRREGRWRIRLVKPVGRLDTGEKATLPPD